MAQSNSLAVQEKGIIASVEKKISALQTKGDIHFPENYSPQNALRSAWLVIQETVDRNKKPVLEVCTQESVANALLNTVVLGLNPAKSQIYYIAYGNKLLAQPSYLGQVKATKDLKGVISVFAQVVYKGDELEYTIDDAVIHITNHSQKLTNIDNNNIIAAYATLKYEDKSGDVVDYSQIMTIDEIKQAWKQSPMNPIDDKEKIKSGSTHGKFTQEMAKKTVLNRTCKMFLKTSDDSSLVIKALNESSAYVEQSVEEEIEENANQEVIDISDFEEKEEPKKEESKELTAEQKKKLQDAWDKTKKKNATPEPEEPEESEPQDMFDKNGNELKPPWEK